MNIFTLNKDELYRIKDLWQELNQHHHNVSTYFKKHFAGFTFEQRIGALIKKEKLIVFAASENNHYIGYCIATKDQEIGEIDSIYIKDAFRGKDVGKQLMTKALSWLDEQGCKTIKVAIAEGNERALDFYRQFGFSERLIMMQKG
jgi:ribosomal protein S18 acetylase RimI-like enzyme